MIFSSKTENWIFEKLKQGPVLVPELIKTRNIKATPEAIYLGIRNLVKDKLVIKNGKQLSLDLMTVEKFSRELETILDNYKTNKKLHTIVGLAEGESAVYRFNNYESFDRFWNQVSLEYIRSVQNKEGTPYIILDSTYYWWLLYPRESFLFLDLLKKHNFEPMLMFDERISFPPGLVSKIRSSGAQVAFGSTGKYFKAYNVFGDYIIEITYPAETYQMLLVLFKDKRMTIDQARKLVETMSPLKVKLQRNKKKAALLLKNHSKGFVLKLK